MHRERSNVIVDVCCLNLRIDVHWFHLNGATWDHIPLNTGLVFCCIHYVVSYFEREYMPLALANMFMCPFIFNFRSCIETQCKLPIFLVELSPHCRCECRKFAKPRKFLCSLCVCLLIYLFLLLLVWILGVLLHTSYLPLVVYLLLFVHPLLKLHVVLIFQLKEMIC